MADGLRREIPPENKKGRMPLSGYPPFGVRIKSADRGHVPGTCPQRSVPAAAAAEAAPAATAAARAGTIGPGPGLVDRQRTALEVLAVQPGNGLVGLFLVRHLDEAETAALARERAARGGASGDDATAQASASTG